MGVDDAEKGRKKDNDGSEWGRKLKGFCLLAIKSSSKLKFMLECSRDDCSGQRSEGRESAFRVVYVFFLSLLPLQTTNEAAGKGGEAGSKRL